MTSSNVTQERPEPALTLGLGELLRLGECMHTVTRRLLQAKPHSFPSAIAEAAWFREALALEAPDFLQFGAQLRDAYLKLGGSRYHPSGPQEHLYWETLEEAISTLASRRSMRESRRQEEDVPDTEQLSQVRPVNVEDLAQEIIDSAFADGYSYPSTRKQEARAEFALAIDAHCPDAYLILGGIKERAGLFPLAEEAYDTAAKLAAERWFGGEEALLKHHLNNRREPLWYVSGGRAYLRSRAGQAALLWKQQEYKRAIALYQLLLKLNPPDNQGLRDDLICMLMEAGDLKALGSALKKTRRHTFDDGHSEDIAGTLWHYTHALYQFRLAQNVTQSDAADTESKETEATRALQVAFSHNKYVPLLLLSQERLPENMMIAYYSKGDATEASMYVDMGAKAWRKVSGALEWLERSALEAHLLPARRHGGPKITVNVIEQEPDEQEAGGQESGSTHALHIKRVQLFGESGTYVPLEVSRAAAEKTLRAFWKRVVFVGDERGCWLWSGDEQALLYYDAEPWYMGTYKVDALHLAWTIGTGRVLADSYSELMSRCQSPACINPAHRLEVISLDRIYGAIKGDCYPLGEDDCRELAWLFSTDVANKSFSWIQETISWNGRQVVPRHDYEQWRHTRGKRAEDAFLKKYLTPMKYWRVLGSEGCGERQGASRASTEERMLTLGIQEESMPRLTERYQQLVIERGGAPIDEQAARYHLQRLFSRLVVKGGCWYWDKPEGSRYRLVKNGPTLEPRFLLWRLLTDRAAHPIHTTIASHDGDSDCLCPAHSDILLDTTDAAALLFVTASNPSEGLRLHHTQLNPIRSVIHQAVEAHELPYRINAKSGIDLWRTDVLSWYENHRERVSPLVKEGLASLDSQEQE